MFKSIILLCCLMPFFALGNTYNNEVGFFQMMADLGSDVINFFYTDVPSLAQRFFAYVLVWLVKAKLYAQIEAMQFAWGVAKVIIQDLNIMSQITAQASALPQDLKTILVESRFFDGLNILINGYLTKFVLNFTKGF